jgi:hypothetical protein
MVEKPLRVAGDVDFDASRRMQPGDTYEYMSLHPPCHGRDPLIEAPFPPGTPL